VNQLYQGFMIWYWRRT